MSKQPTHTIFAVVGDSAEDKGTWTPVGVAWSHAGNGFGISFDSKRTSDGPQGVQLIDIPAGCRLVVRPRAKRQAASHDRAARYRPRPRRGSAAP